MTARSWQARPKSGGSNREQSPIVRQSDAGYYGFAMPRPRKRIHWLAKPKADKRSHARKNESQHRNPEGALRLPPRGTMRDIIDRRVIRFAIDPATVAPTEPMPRRHRVFADLVWDGYPQAYAYRQAYDAKWHDPHTCEVHGDRLANLPTVAVRLTQLEMVARVVVKDQQEQRRKLVLDGLEDVATDRGHNQRVKALELLGKVRGVDLFTSPDTKPNDLTPDQVTAQLLARLRELGLDMKDVTPGRMLEHKPEADK